jgi:hypothetical protein
MVFFVRVPFFCAIPKGKKTGNLCLISDLPTFFFQSNYSWHSAILVWFRFPSTMLYIRHGAIPLVSLLLKIPQTFLPTLYH